MIGLGDLKDVSRADFLTSVGLYVLSDRLVMVRLRKSLLKVSMLEQETRPLPQGDNRQAISELTGWVAEDVGDEAEARIAFGQQVLESFHARPEAERDQETQAREPASPPSRGCVAPAHSRVGRGGTLLDHAALR